ncbi:MAG: hypothetical protein KAG89_10915 [Fulvimarina manganoxydans]|uniref:hypothetical protein n=1 Tax=Fulvimarina manganoxydans TaxID=937218 RepID=UPI00235762E4|nr:hypothetical protein [Fulvimarina manganoxydans]MCK5932669.1 hypothetical protein [Fulvimarina manganoxydans]
MRYAPNRRAKLGLAALASAAVLTMTGAGSAFSQSSTQPQLPNAAAQGDAASPAGRDDANRKGGERHAWNSHHGKHGGKHHGRHGGRGAMMSPAAIAAGLATLETGIGITPEQMGPWREFTGAAVAFAEAVQPPRGGRQGWREKDGARMMPNADAESEADLQSEDGAASAPNSGANATANSTADASDTTFPFASRMADRAIAAGAAGERLKSAMADLDGVLTVEQKQTAHNLVRSMMREARDHRGGRGKDGRGHRGGHDGPRSQGRDRG